jgi:hypothetical protein
VKFPPLDHENSLSGWSASSSTLGCLHHRDIVIIDTYRGVSATVDRIRAIQESLPPR